MRDVINQLHGFLELSAKGVWSFDDIPAIFCLYPWLQPRNGASVIHNPAWASHGHRWGMSGGYDGKTPQYAVPDAVFLHKGADPALFLTGSQAFEFILAPDLSVPALERHRHVKAWRPRVKIERVTGPEALDTIERVFPNVDGVWEHADYPQRFMAMAGELTRLSPEGVRFYTHTTDGRVSGFQIVWEGSDDLLQVFRYALPEFRDTQRVMDLQLLDIAASEGWTVNVGDGFRMPSLQAYKRSLAPIQIRSFINVLAHQEAADYERSAPASAKNHIYLFGNPGVEVGAFAQRWLG